jgi:rRNA pseudouridine-1189 N-methylase Emg1 (Nep1/Mra1 family)
LIQKENKSNHKGWNWKTISIKKRIRKIKNNNQKNDDHILYKNQMSMDKIKKKHYSIKDSRPNILHSKEWG